MELQAIRACLTALSSNDNSQQQIDGLRNVCSTIEAAEGKFRDVCGVPYQLGGVTKTRSHQLNKILAVIKDNEDAYERVADGWVLHSSASLQQQAVGLRFLFCTLSCWGYQYPLSEEPFLEKLVLWCGASSPKASTTPTLHDPPPPDEIAMLEEERAVYAHGLLAISMSSIEYADEAVRTPAAPFAAQYLRRSVQQQQQQQQQPDRDTPAAAGNAPASAPPLTASASAPASASASASAATPCTTTAAPTSSAGGAATEGGCQQTSTLPNSGVAVSVAGQHEGPQGGSISAVPSSLSLRAFALRKLRMCICCQFLSKLGEYVEALAPILQEGGVDTLIKLLEQHANDPRILYDTLDALCALLAHKRFAELFVAAGGVQLMLGIPRNQHSFNGLSLALYGLASLPEAFERVCMLPDPLVEQLVQATLQLLGSGYDAARKNAALFLGSTLHFRAVLEAFDKQGGVRQLLVSLRAGMVLLSSSDTTLDLRIERQIAHYVCHALLQWLRAHLVLHTNSLRRPPLARPSPLNPTAPVPTQPLPYKPVGDVGQEAMDGLLWTLDVDRRLAEAFARSPWPALEKLLSLGGVELLLEVVMNMQPVAERPSHDLIVSALQALQLVALSPFARKAVAGTMMSQSHRPGIGILLSLTAQPASTFLQPDYEVVGHALHVLVVCLAPPPSLAQLLSYAEAPQPQEPEGASDVGRQQQEDLNAAGAGNPQPPLPSSQPHVASQQQQGGAPNPDHGLSVPHPPPAGFRSALVRDASAIEAVYAYVRQCVRAAHGIRVLKALLQPRASAPSHVISQHALEKVRALAALALLGMARDPPTRHVLSRLQVGRLLAELVRDPHNSLTSLNGSGIGASMGLPRTPAPRTADSRAHSGHPLLLGNASAASAAEDSATEGGGGRAAAAAGPGEAEDTGAVPMPRSRLSPVCGTGLPGAGGARTWPEAFHRASMELIALTATNTAVGRIDRVAAAAHDAAGGGPALHRLEKAAIAAATPLTYAPQELLLLIYEHLRASGLREAASTLAKEAQLPKAQQMLASMGLIAPPANLPLQQPQLQLQQQQQQQRLGSQYHPSSMRVRPSFATPQLPPACVSGGEGADARTVATEGAKPRGGSGRSRNRRRASRAALDAAAEQLPVAPAGTAAFSDQQGEVWGGRTHGWLQAKAQQELQGQETAPPAALVQQAMPNKGAGDCVQVAGRTRRRKSLGAGGSEDGRVCQSAPRAAGAHPSSDKGTPHSSGQAAVVQQGGVANVGASTPHFMLQPTASTTPHPASTTPSLQPLRQPLQFATPMPLPYAHTPKLGTATAASYATTHTAQGGGRVAPPIPLSAHLRNSSCHRPGGQAPASTPHLSASRNTTTTYPQLLPCAAHAPSGFASPMFGAPATTPHPPPSLAPPFSSSVPSKKKAGKGTTKGGKSRGSKAGKLAERTALKEVKELGGGSGSGSRGVGEQEGEGPGAVANKSVSSRRGSSRKQQRDVGGATALAQEGSVGVKEHVSDDKGGGDNRQRSKAQGQGMKRKAAQLPSGEERHAKARGLQKQGQADVPAGRVKQSRNVGGDAQATSPQQQPDVQQQQQQQALSQHQQQKQQPRSSRTKQRKERHPDHPRSARHLARTHSLTNPSPAAPFSYCTPPVAPSIHASNLHDHTQGGQSDAVAKAHALAARTFPALPIEGEVAIAHAPAHTPHQADHTKPAPLSFTPATAHVAPADMLSMQSDPLPANLLLANLPSRKANAVVNTGAGTGGLGQAAALTPVPKQQQQQQQQEQEQHGQPAGLPVHVQAAVAQLDAVDGPPVASKLNTIIMAYLRQMHRQACMLSSTPIAVLPAVPLSKPYSLPQPLRTEEAPVNVSRRVVQRETVGGHGGRGGAKADRQMIYSRFRPLRTFRCDGGISMCAAFCAKTNLLVVGSHSGDLTVHDVFAGEVIDSYEAHVSPTTMLRSISNPWGAEPDATLLLSSSKNEVKLWDGLALGQGAVATWEGATKASFSSNAEKAIGVLVPPSGQSNSSARQAAIWDVRSHRQLLTLEEALSAGSTGLLSSPGLLDQRNRSVPAPCFGPSDSPLVLWGASLWDIRCPPRVLHTFDVFSETRATSSCFNPAGHPEVVLNSEVWDLRTYKLLRSVPALDGTQLAFSGNGSVAYATLRRSEELGSLLAPRRARHNLHCAFRVLDPSDAWGELATVDVERAVVDLATEESDSLLAVVCLDTTDSTLSSNVRLLEVGRQRMADDSDDEEEEEDSQDVEESDEDIVDSDFLSGSDGDEGGDTPATGTPHHNRRRHQAGRAGRGMQDGGALVGAARRVAAALGRMERQRQEDEGGSEGEDSDGWDDEEEELRAQMMEGMGSPFSAMEEGEGEEQQDEGSSIDLGSDSDEYEDEEDEGEEIDDEEDGGSFDSADFDAAFGDDSGVESGES